jgi:hypothetical protein
MIQYAHANVRSLTLHAHKLIRHPFQITSWVSISLGLGLLLCPLAAWADPVSPDSELLLAQRIVDGLPPAPPLPPAILPQSGSATTPSFPASSTSPSVNVPTLQNTVPAELPSQTPTTAPQSPTTATVAAQRYAVLVNGNSPLLLDQVRKVESGAFLQDHDGHQVIQAGLFSEPSRADQQVAALAEQGIGAEVVFVTRTIPVASTPTMVSYASSSSLPEPDLLPATSTQREVIFGQAPSFDNADSVVAASSSVELPDNSYYVVIPGRTAELRDISLIVTYLSEGLNVQENAILERESPLGPHVIVGPFVNRSAAFRWNDYFRAFGLVDSRVYYRR